MHTVDLVAQSYPVGLYIVRSTEKLNLPCTGTHSFDDAINLIRFVTRSSNFGNDDIAVQSTINLWVAFTPHQTMLFAVIQPMARPARPDDSLQLIGLDPDDFVDPLVSPKLQAFATQFHGSSSYPEEHQTFVLEGRNAQLSHLVVGHSPIWKLHMNVPWRVRHYHCKFAQNRHVQITKIALNPLRWVQRQVRTARAIVQTWAVF